MSRDFAEFGGYKIERGRLITPMEIDRKRPVAIIGWDVADKLFKDRTPSTRRSRSPAPTSAWSG